MTAGTILIFPGEGIGPEIVGQARNVLRAVERRFDLRFAVEQHEVGLLAQAAEGDPLPPRARAACDRHRDDPRAAILFGAVVDEPIGILRKDYDLFANLRPVKLIASLAGLSPLRDHLLQGVDLLIVRELASGIYYGAARHSGEGSTQTFVQEMVYSDHEMRRISRIALAAAAQRRKRLVFVHKANVIKELFGHWLQVVHEESARFPEVAVTDLHVDNMAMQLVLRPAQFDVILADNMFGDILSDLTAGLAGSIGLLPSSSRNAAGFGLYESIGGTAPEIAGRDLANPTSTILSLAMMLRDTFGAVDAADAVERAIEHALERGRTADVAQAGLPVLGTAAFGAAVVAALDEGRR